MNGLRVRNHWFDPSLRVLKGHGRAHRRETSVWSIMSENIWDYNEVFSFSVISAVQQFVVGMIRMLFVLCSGKSPAQVLIMCHICHKHERQCQRMLMLNLFISSVRARWLHWHINNENMKLSVSAGSKRLWFEQDVSLGLILKRQSALNAGHVDSRWNYSWQDSQRRRKERCSRVWWDLNLPRARGGDVFHQHHDLQLNNKR